MRLHWWCAAYLGEFESKHVGSITLLLHLDMHHTSYYSIMVHLLLHSLLRRWDFVLRRPRNRFLVRHSDGG